MAQWFGFWLCESLHVKGPLLYVVPLAYQQMCPSFILMHTFGKNFKWERTKERILCNETPS